NALPDLCLRNIFSLLPLRDQTRLNLVCDRWSCLQPSVTCKRRTLVLTLVDRNWVNQRQTDADAIPYRDDLVREPEQLNLLDPTNPEPSLEFSNFHRQIADFVSTLFPQLTSLEFNIDAIKPSDIDNIIAFLETVQATLESFKFFC